MRRNRNTNHASFPTFFFSAFLSLRFNETTIHNAPRTADDQRHPTPHVHNHHPKPPLHPLNLDRPRRALLPQQRRRSLSQHLAARREHLRGLAVRGQRLLVAGEVVQDALCDDEDVLGEVEGGGDDEEGEEEEEDGVCRRGRR